jgi:hypothetical protein
MDQAESVVQTECGSITNLWNNQKNCGRLGFEIKLTQDGKPDITKLEDIAADTEDDSARFIIIEHVINSMGYSLEIVPPEK